MLKNPVFWIAIIALVLLLFGASRLPDIAGNVGKSLKVFKKEIKELQDDTDVSIDDKSNDSTDGRSSEPTGSAHSTEQRRDENTTT